MYKDIHAVKCNTEFYKSPIQNYKTPGYLINLPEFNFYYQTKWTLKPKHSKLALIQLRRHFIREHP